MSMQERLNTCFANGFAVLTGTDCKLDIQHWDYQGQQFTTAPLMLDKFSGLAVKKVAFVRERAL